MEDLNWIQHITLCIFKVDFFPFLAIEINNSFCSDILSWHIERAEEQQEQLPNFSQTAVYAEENQTGT